MVSVILLLLWYKEINSSFCYNKGFFDLNSTYLTNSNYNENPLDPTKAQLQFQKQPPYKKIALDKETINSFQFVLIISG